MRKPLVVLLIAALALSTSCSLYSSPVCAKPKEANTEDPSLKNFDLGIDCVKRGDWDGAIDAFLQSTYFARNNYQPKSYYWLGVSYEAKHEDLKAIEAAKKYVQQSLNGAPDGHVLLAELYFRNNRDDECVSECGEAFSSGTLTADAARAHWIYGKLFERQEKYDMAQFQYEFALGETPWTFTDAWMSYAEMFMKTKNFVSALEQFEGILKSPKKLKGLVPCRIYRDMGVCLLAKGDHEGALRNWHTALDFDQSDADTHLDLAMMFDAERHLSSALTEYKQFVRYSRDPYKLGKAKQRIAMLDQKLAPAEPAYVAKPSPYSRMQQQQMNNQQQDTGPPPSKDSGF